jgi:hypothetical protein
MDTPEWKLEFYEENGREPVLDFLRGLDQIKEQSLAAALRVVSVTASITCNTRRCSSATVD